MTDKKQSIQKAVFIKTENYTTKNGHPGTKLHYTWLKDDGTKKDVYVQWVNQYLNEDSKKILESLKMGSEFVAVKEEDGQYWNFKELRNISTYQPKPVWDGGKSDNPAGKYRGSGKSNYDDTGVKVGAARNQAIAYLSATRKEGNWGLDDIDQLAYEIVERQAIMEENVRSGNKQMEEDKSKQESHQQDQDDDSSVPF